jgi:hypothetical protein
MDADHPDEWAGLPIPVLTLLLNGVSVACMRMVALAPGFLSEYVDVP